MLLGSTNSVSIYNTMSSDFNLVMLGLTKWKEQSIIWGLREFGYSLLYMMQKKQLCVQAGAGNKAGTHWDYLT